MAAGGCVVSAVLLAIVGLLAGWAWYLDTRGALVLAVFVVVVLVADTARAVRRP